MSKTSDSVVDELLSSIKNNKNMSTCIGPENDLSAKQILLDIKNEEEFIRMCNINKTMRDICDQSTDFWIERVQKWHPKFAQIKEQTGLSWKQVYPIIVLCHHLADEDDDDVYNDRLGKYLANIDFDPIKGRKFLETEYDNEGELVNYFYINLLKQEKFKLIKKLRSMKEFDLKIKESKIDENDYVPINYIFETQGEISYDLFEKRASKWESTRRKEFVDKFLENDEYENYWNIVLLTELAVGGTYNIKNYLYKLTPKILNKFVFYKLLRSELKDFQNVILYMIANKIQFDFDYIYPTNKFIKHVCALYEYDYEGCQEFLEDDPEEMDDEHFEDLKIVDHANDLLSAAMMEIDRSQKDMQNIFIFLEIGNVKIPTDLTPSSKLTRILKKYFNEIIHQ